MSSSTPICTVSDEEFIVIKDISESGFEFSDGCGYASQEIMEKVAQKFDLHQTSAIQIRFGGFKGVLMAHPGLKNLKGIQILFRESMKKFEGNLRELSVIRCATYSPAYLNR
jgi:hypothetical protein